MALSTPPTAPQRGDRATFASRVDAFITWLIGFVSELNNFSAEMNTIASGGAYAIPYTWGTGGGAGLLNVGGAPSDQYLATSLDISNISAAGQDISPLLVQFDQSTSTVKGYIRIVHVSDPARFMVFAITARTSNASPAYQWVQGSMVEATAVNPFAMGDSVLLYFDRTGDKGDTGAAGANGATPGTYAVTISNRIAATTAGNSVSGANTRAFNTVENNTISGASLASNTLTLPAGTYRYWGRAPGYGSGYHTCYLYNSTSSAVINQGSTGYNGVSTDQSDSVVCGYFTLSAQSGVQLLHNFTNATTNGLGQANNSIGSGINVYAQLTVEKLS